MPIATTVLERGNIYFFYCPKAKATQNKKHKINSVAGVQGFYLVLHPEDKSLYRLWNVTDKQLPLLETIEQKTTLRVDAVEHDATNILRALDQHAHYKNITKPFLAARPCGEGVYVLFQHHDHSHFAYTLSLPEKLGEVQQGLHIAKRGNYTIAIKNNTFSNSLSKTDLPSYLVNQFQARASIPLSHLDFLNYPGIAFILMNGCQAYIAEVDFNQDFADLFKDLALWANHRPLAPLMQGKWE